MAVFDEIVVRTSEPEESDDMDEDPNMVAAPGNPFRYVTQHDDSFA